MTLPPLVDKTLLLALPGVSNDTLATFAVDWASAYFRSVTRNRVSYVEDDVETRWGSGTRTLTLRCDKVIVTDDHPVSVTVDGIVLDPSCYICRRDTGVLVHKWDLWCQDAEIVVTYSHGFAVIPDDVQRVVLAAARNFYDQRPQGLTSQTIGGETYAFAPTIGATQEWVDVAANYTLNRGDEA